jgi:hypothetical protein
MKESMVVPPEFAGEDLTIGVYGGVPHRHILDSNERELTESTRLDIVDKMSCACSKQSELAHDRIT